MASSPFDEIEHVDAAVGIVRNAAGEPMAARFDEFAFVQAGAFFAPAGARGDWFRSD